jgi:stage III sporulation protein SpoIIIAA
MLMDMLPDFMRREIGDPMKLMELVLDLGRPLLLKFEDGSKRFGPDCTVATLNSVLQQFQNSTPTFHFSREGRAGLDRTLHRISAIRNASGEVIGLTIRVGKHVEGTAEILADLLQLMKSDPKDNAQERQSILLLGKESKERERERERES